jgi:hypothetical protein
MSRLFELSVLAPASSIKFRLVRTESCLGGKEAFAAGGGDGSDADRFKRGPTRRHTTRGPEIRVLGGHLDDIPPSRE